MDEIRIALLKGLQASGKNKTLTEILTDSRIGFTSTEELEAANSLESLGLIRTYKLPAETRAELTSAGIEFLASIV